jgi:glutamine amidotransferase
MSAAITVVDYDAGNVGSVLNICHKAGGAARATSDPAEIAKATKLILPGVGHFGSAMQRLHANGLVEALNAAVLGRRIPILGICLGMQLLTEHSEEGDAAGLGWIKGRTVRFRPPAGSPVKVPHMGWNRAEPSRPDPLVQDLPDEPRFYFVHSYYVACENEGEVLMRTTHGRAFASAIHRDNIWGVQFHPEKSHKFGLALIRNFVGLSGASC